MHNIEKKVKAGSPVTQKDIIQAIDHCLNNQGFANFYNNGDYDSYISGMAVTDKEKSIMEAKVYLGISHYFAPLMLLATKRSPK